MRAVLQSYRSIDETRGRSAPVTQHLVCHWFEESIRSMSPNCTDRTRNEYVGLLKDLARSDLNMLRNRYRTMLKARTLLHNLASDEEALLELAHEQGLTQLLLAAASNSLGGLAKETASANLLKLDTATDVAVGLCEFLAVMLPKSAQTASPGSDSTSLSREGAPLGQIIEASGDANALSQHVQTTA